jgi:AcrR family transcriptional regulator
MEIKDRIIDVATEMFSKHGFSKVTTDDLAQEIGISKRTLYNYFPSKVELFDQVFKISMEKTRQQVDDIMNQLQEKNSDLLDVLQQLMHLEHKNNLKMSKQLFDDIVRYTPENLKCMEEFKESHMKEIFNKLFERASELGHIKENLDKEIVYMMLYHSMDNIIRPKVLYNMPYTPLQVERMIFEILLTGMLTEEGMLSYNEKQKKYEN